MKVKLWKPFPGVSRLCSGSLERWDVVMDLRTCRCVNELLFPLLSFFKKDELSTHWAKETSIYKVGWINKAASTAFPTCGLSQRDPRTSPNLYLSRASTLINKVPSLVGAATTVITSCGGNNCFGRPISLPPHVAAASDLESLPYNQRGEWKDFCGEERSAFVNEAATSIGFVLNHKRCET